MKKDFEVIDHTADIGLRAFGADLPEAFANAARGMFSLITNLDSIREVICKDLKVEAPDKEVLLVEWLNELLFYFDTEQILFRRFDIDSLTETEVRARCYGEKTDRSRHILKMGIKSTTYHLLKVEKKKRYRVQVLFDI
jgi:SHS2 domain-containing protein